jgi:hypothetical protein
MVNFSIRVKENKVKGDLAQFRSYLGKLTGDLLTQEACLTARMALKLSPPMLGGESEERKGDTAEAGKMGERAIDKDVRSIFADGKATLGGVFHQKAGSRARFSSWRSLKTPKLSSTLLQDLFSDPEEDKAYAKASSLFANKLPRNAIVTSMGAASSIHRKERRRGRVVNMKGPSEEVKKYPVIMKEALIKKYIALRQRVVGKLKSGWYDIINTHGRNLKIFGRVVDSGSKHLPKYITSKRFRNGVLSKAFSGNSKRISISNSYGDAEGAATERGTHGAVIRGRLFALSKRPYQVYANRIVRNWNSNQRPGA